jgi:predicted RNA-binding protein YlxR (DUF448 family)
LAAREKRDSEGSERTCIVTGAKGPPEAMLHFAISPDGEVVPDLRRKLPGRGVWIRLSRLAVAQAVRKQAFSRGFREKAVAPPDLAERVDRLIERDALQFLSIVNKSGLVVTGAAKVEAAIKGGDVVALLHASDGAADGVAKLERLANGCFGPRAGQVARINLFASSQLDLALGRTNVIHAALGAGEASAAFLSRVRRLADYRANDANELTGPPVLAAAEEQGTPRGDAGVD